MGSDPRGEQKRKATAEYVQGCAPRNHPLPSPSVLRASSAGMDGRLCYRTSAQRSVGNFDRRCMLCAYAKERTHAELRRRVAPCGGTPHAWTLVVDTAVLALVLTLMKPHTKASQQRGSRCNIDFLYSSARQWEIQRHTA